MEESTDEARIGEWFEALLAQHDDETAALDDAFRALKGAGLLSKVVLHRYQCSRGCQIAVVFRAAGRLLCAVRDYKYSPGMNERQSVAAARAKNTLDGNRHWPDHVYDVIQLDRFGTHTQPAGITMNCRHHLGTVLTRDIRSAVATASPGRPGAPTRL
jgi:hypothetical protein